MFILHVKYQIMMKQYVVKIFVLCALRKSITFTYFARNFVIIQAVVASVLYIPIIFNQYRKRCWAENKFLIIIHAVVAYNFDRVVKTRVEVLFIIIFFWLILWDLSFFINDSVSWVCVVFFLFLNHCFKLMNMPLCLGRHVFCKFYETNGRLLNAIYVTGLRISVNISGLNIWKANGFNILSM